MEPRRKGGEDLLVGGLVPDEETVARGAVVCHSARRGGRARKVHRRHPRPTQVVGRPVPEPHELPSRSRGVTAPSAATASQRRAGACVARSGRGRTRVPGGRGRGPPRDPRAGGQPASGSRRAHSRRRGEDDAGRWPRRCEAGISARRSASAGGASRWHPVTSTPVRCRDEAPHRARAGGRHRGMEGSYAASRLARSARSAQRWSRTSAARRRGVGRGRR